MCESFQLATGLAHQSVFNIWNIFASLQYILIFGKSKAGSAVGKSKVLFHAWKPSELWWMTIIIYKRLKHLCLIRMRSARAPRGFIYSVSEKSVPLKASSGRQREGFVCGVHHRWAATPCYSSLYISSLYLYFCVFLCLYLCICIDVFVPMARHPLCSFSLNI